MLTLADRPFRTLLDTQSDRKETLALLALNISGLIPEPGPALPGWFRGGRGPAESAVPFIFAASLHYVVLYL